MAGSMAAVRDASRSECSSGRPSCALILKVVVAASVGQELDAARLGWGCWCASFFNAPQVGTRAAQAGPGHVESTRATKSVQCMIRVGRTADWRSRVVAAEGAIALLGHMALAQRWWSRRVGQMLSNYSILFKQSNTFRAARQGCKFGEFHGEKKGKVRQVLLTRLVPWENCMRMSVAYSCSVDNHHAW